VRWVVAFTLGTGPLLLGAAVAHAEDKAKAVLVYERIDRARDACPDDATMRSLVAARLGYDPFVEQADSELHIELRPDGDDFTARVTRTSTDGTKMGERTLQSTGGDCSELASSVSLAVALAIDPEAARHPHPEVAPPAPVPAPMPPPVVAPPVPPPPVKAPIAHRPNPTLGPRLGLRIDGGIVVGAGVVPGVSFGPRLGVGLDGTFWSLSGEFTGIVPGSETTPYGTVSASVVYGALVPCFHAGFARIWMADFCVAGAVGAISSDATNVSRSFPSTKVYASIDPRAGMTVAPWPILGFRLAADLGVALTRVHLNIDDAGTPREVWVSPAASFLGYAGVLLRFR